MSGDQFKFERRWKNKIQHHPITFRNSLQAWKSGTHPMGPDVRPYSAEPPVSGEEVDMTGIEFKLVKMEVDPRKPKGWEQFSFKLPQSVRAMHHQDVVYGQDWRALIKEFDDRLPVTS